MTSQWWSSARQVLLFAACAFMINAAVGVFVNPMPQQLLVHAAAEVSGWEEDELEIKAGGYGGNWVSQRAYLELQPEGGREVLYVEMTRPLHILPWHMSEYRAGK